MAIDSYKIKKSLNIAPQTAPTLDSAGDMGVSSSDDQIKVYLGGAIRDIVTTDQAQTLTNKVIDASQLVNDSITTSKISDDSITLAKVAQEVLDAITVSDGSITTAKLSDLAVTTLKLADGAVTTAKVSDQAIGNAQLADGAIDNAKLQTDAVEGANILDGSISSSKIQGDAVQTVHISDASITTAKLVDGAVTTAKISDGAVTAAKLDPAINLTPADGSITTAKLSDGAVTTVKLSDLAVTTAKISDGSVTAAKLDPSINLTPADGSITTAKLSDDAVTSAKLADGAVQTAHISDESITTSKIVAQAVTTVKLSDGSITAAKLADAAVTTAKVSDLSITTAKISDGSITAAKLANGMIGLAGSTTSQVTITPSAGFGTTTNGFFTRQRVGDTAIFSGRFAAGTVAASTAYITLPNAVDYSKISNAASGMVVGYWRRVRVPSSGTDTSTPLFLDGSSTTDVFFNENSTGSGALTKFNASSLISSTDIVEINLFPLPIQGWDANVTMASDPAAIPTLLIVGGNAASTSTDTPYIFPTTTKSQNVSYNASTGEATILVAGDYDTGGFLSAAAGGVAVNLWVNGVSTRMVGYFNASAVTNISGKVTLAVGDVVTLRPGATSDIDANSSWTLSRITGSTSIAIDGPQDELYLYGGVGHGSTGTTTRTYTSTPLKQTGTAITYTSSATNGDSFTINRGGIYSMSASDSAGGGSGRHGLTLNSSSTSTSISSLSTSQILGWTHSSTGLLASVSVTTRLVAGDIIRVQDAGADDAGTAHVRITRIAD